MVIGYNENALVTDYLDCASIMEAAVNLFQEMKENEKAFYTYMNEGALNEAVDIKAIKDKIISTLKSWLAKILGIIRKIKSIIVEKLSKKPSVNIKESNVKFSFESYDLEKITIDTLNKISLFGEEISFPKSSNDPSYEQYVKNKIKDWTGKSDKMDCTAGDIKQYFYDEYCGGEKITITEKTPGYSPNTFNTDSGTVLNRYLSNLEKDSENAMKLLKKSINDVSDKEVSNYMYRAYFNYMSLNSSMIVAISNIITEKLALNNKVMSIYTKAEYSKEDKADSSSSDISYEFKAAVANNKILRVRIMLKDSLLVDKSFKQVDEYIKYAKKKGINLFDNHEETDDFTTDKSKWNENYMNKQLVLLPNNFSHERLNHLKKVISYVYNK